jgi:hypothetical protein
LVKDFVVDSSASTKGRAFRAACAAFVEAPLVFPEAQSDNSRPVWAVFVGDDTSIRPFVANLRLGRRADCGDDLRIEFLRSLKFRAEFQREAEGTIATLYHPSLFALDPGMIDPEGASFVMLVPDDWARTQRLDVPAMLSHVEGAFPDCKLEVDELAGLAPAACLFAAYLDRRTRCPLPNDPRFYFRLFLAALDRKLAGIACEWSRYGSSVDQWGRFRSSGYFDAYGLDRAGVRDAVAFRCEHADLEVFLAEQVAAYFKKTRSAGEV